MDEESFVDSINSAFVSISLVVGMRLSCSHKKYSGTLQLKG